MVDLTGTERASGVPEDCAKKIISKAAALGIAANAGIGPTIGSAWAASRSGRSAVARIHPPIKSSLYDFKISSLRLNEDILSPLRECGIEILGELFQIPVKSLGQRFGASVVSRIDELLGAQDETLCLIKEKARITRGIALEIPIISAEALRKRLLIIFKGVFEDLSKRKLAASRFRIALQTRAPDGQRLIVKKELALFSASRDEAHLESVLFPIIEKISAPSGVEKIAVSGLDCARSKDLQVDSDGKSSSLSEELGLQTLNHLISRLGPSRVLCLRRRGSYTPEKSFSYEALGEKSFIKTSGPASPLLPAHRPAFLLRRPLAIKALALLPDSPPKTIWIKGLERKILKSMGPERISLEWWQDSSQASHRDYFKLQDESGLWIWAYRDGASLDWFIHGIWS